ncbi:hypothetical protein IFM47457_04173 [Aspergillus lentulus]|nr:hypothetical protein IFM47457_04173 [Aspergillus lentulus]
MNYGAELALTRFHSTFTQPNYGNPSSKYVLNEAGREAPCRPYNSTEGGWPAISVDRRDFAAAYSLYGDTKYTLSACLSAPPHAQESYPIGYLGDGHMQPCAWADMLVRFDTGIKPGKAAGGIEAA